LAGPGEAVLEKPPVQVPPRLLVDEAAPEPAPTLADADGHGFLLRVWNLGFWLMPPGGLTRHLIPTRVIINPDEAVPQATG